ncbi:MAG: SPFH domain-containing protein [Candidatus Sumerlaeales bacterium]|nr:SPFH domain-containing protein [Candidatus Sumerlaeales bacterium]
MAIIDVVKFDGPPTIYAWKFPNEELSTFTQVIVNESQEAVLFKGGQALDVFSPGRHTLDTTNIPLLDKLINLPFGGQSPFSAEVWFVNKAFTLDVKWGTPTPIQIQDPKYKIFLPVRSHGQFGLQISDSRKFLTKLVGTISVFTREYMTQYFRGLYLTRAKDAISSYLVKKQITLLEINAYLNELSQFIGEEVKPTFDEYGISISNFYVTDISTPEDDSAVKQLKAALAKKAEMEIIGYNYTQERSFDTLEGAAKNTGGAQAGLMGAGIGLGMGLGVGGTMGGAMGTIAQSINTQPPVKCPKCGADNLQTVKFCGTCGASLVAPAQAPAPAEQVKCCSCGKSFPKTAKFCPECGDPYLKCEFCGADRPDTTSPCPECGKAPLAPCPKCGANTNNGTNKFCPDCGTPFETKPQSKCPDCGCVVKDGAKFCPDCGKKLQ